jgi:molybdopterin-containing oxidoreductase family iron-sulfur binding subunit
MNNPESKISKLLQIRPLYDEKEKKYVNDKDADNPRAYSVLEEIGVRPNVFYLAKVRNRENTEA